MLKGQDSTKSLAIKGNLPYYRITLFYPTTIYNDLWNIFNLNKAANAGEAPAQHELGIRYLTGQGVFADTAKSAYWIKKAADQKLVSACYNYGILLSNGWGLKWNPVEAYKNFLYAAENGMPEAQYAVGIFYTDDLVVERNWDVAYLWIKKAADNGSKAAKDVLPEIEKRISKTVKKDTVFSENKIDQIIKDQQVSKAKVAASQSSGLMFLDFNRDTTAEITDENIWDEFAKMVKSVNPADTLIVKDSLDLLTDKLLNLIKEYGKNGSPEALTVLARLYEKGIFVKKDDIQAITNYLYALRLESPFAPHLLWKMITKKDYTRELKARIDKNDAEARFAWACLFELGLDFHIVKADAFKLLQQASAQNHLPSIVETGLSYYNGSLSEMNKEKALQVWYTAAAAGSDDAKIRIIMSKLINDEEQDIQKSEVFSFLQNLEKKGSIMAQIAYGFCYEKGIGTGIDPVKAAKFYRSAAQRGSRFAYSELKRLYDEYKK